MTTPTMEQAIEALRNLPPQRQQELAGYIVRLAADHREPADIDPADEAAVTTGLEQAKRRKFASPERVASVLGLIQN